MVSVNRKSLEPSVANFSNSYNSGKNAVGETGNYRRGFGRLKAGILGLCALTLVSLSACRMTPQGKSFVQGQVYDAMGTLIRESITKEIWEDPIQNLQLATKIENCSPVNVSPTRRDYPMLFTANEDFQNIGKQIFHSGEKIYINGNLIGVVPNGTIIASKNIHLSSGKSEFVIKTVKVGGYIKSIKVGEFDFIYGRFDATHLAENIGTGEYENIWYANINGEWKELGRVNYAVFDRTKTSRE